MDSTQGFETWYRTEYQRVANSVAVLLGDRDEASEVTSEAFTRALERWDGPRAPRNPTAWTFRVAVNLARRRGRRRLLERRAHDQLSTTLTSSLSTPAIELWKAVADLPERQRLAIVLRYIGGLSEAEVAEAMAIAAGTAAATLSKARRSLAIKLGNDEGANHVG